MFSGKSMVAYVLLTLIASYFKAKMKTTKDGNVVNSGMGPVKGSILTSRDGRDYYAWHRIPFAKPPIGNLRFADPEPVEKWTDVIDGREPGSPCAQVNVIKLLSGDVIGSEDCLHLNIFIPKQLYSGILHEKKPKLPVICAIHGGAFVVGSSKRVHQDFFMDEDVVYVTIQYRLDILGFLTTGDKVVRGNQGLKDQTMALKWLKQNIRNFGGDPNQISIIGTSSGAASVHHHMLSPLSKGLFKGVFSISGAASNPWGLISLEASMQKTEEFAWKFKCPEWDSQKIVDCLRKIDLESLLVPRYLPLMQEYVLLQPHMHGVGFEPIVEAVNDEKAFIAEHPLKILAEGKAQRVPWMVGHTTHEGLVSTAPFRRDLETLKKFERDMVPALKTIFAIENRIDVEDVVEMIDGFYLPQGTTISFDEKLRGYVNMFSDAFFNFDIRESVRHQRNFSPVYYYVHNKTDVPYFMSFFMEIAPMEIGWYQVNSFVKKNILGVEPIFNGISHNADMHYYFPGENLGMNIGYYKGHKHYSYSKDLVKMVAQFATDDTKMEFRGVKIQPTPPTGPILVSEFKNEEVVRSPEPFKDRMDFLQSLNIRPPYVE